MYLLEYTWLVGDYFWIIVSNLIPCVVVGSAATTAVVVISFEIAQDIGLFWHSKFSIL